MHFLNSVPLQKIGANKAPCHIGVLIGTKLHCINVYCLVGKGNYHRFKNYEIMYKTKGSEAVSRGVAATP